MRYQSIANRKAFIAALVTVLVGFGVLNALVDRQLDVDELADRDPKSILAHERDDHGTLVARVLADDAASDRTYLIGGSALREGFVPDLVLSESLGGRGLPDAVSLYSFDQSLAETARIALNLPLTEESIVVLNINPRRLGFSPSTLADEESDSRLSLLPYDPLAEFVEDAGLEELIEAESFGVSSALGVSWSELPVFEHRLFLRNWITGRTSATTSDSWAALSELSLLDVSWSALVDLEPRPLLRPIRYGYSTTALGAAEKAAIAETVRADRVPEYVENSDFGFALLSALVERLNESGAKVVLLDMPRSPLSTEAYAPVWDDYDGSVVDLVQHAGIAHVDLRQPALPDEYFFDLEHLLAPQRQGISDRLVVELAGVVSR